MSTSVNLDIYTARLSGSEGERDLQQTNLEISRRFQQAKNRAGNLDAFEQSLDRIAMDIAAELNLFYQPINRMEGPPVMVFSERFLPPQTLHNFAKKIGA